MVAHVTDDDEYHFPDSVEIVLIGLAAAWILFALVMAVRFILRFT